MPGLASYEANNRERGLVVLGVSVVDDKVGIVKAAKKAKAGFRIISQAKLPDTKAVRGVPNYILYDRNGQVIHEQSGSGGSDGLSKELKAALERALGSSIDVLIIDQDQYKEKSIAKLAQRATTAIGLGKILEQLDKQIAKGSDAEKVEALKLQAEILSYGQDMLAAATNLAATCPHRHYDTMKKLSRAFRGHAIGDQADATYEALRNDPQAKLEIAASRAYEQLRTASEKEKKAIYKKIERKYADTRMGKQALRERDEEG